MYITSKKYIEACINKVKQKTKQKQKLNKNGL